MKHLRNNDYDQSQKFQFKIEFFHEWGAEILTALRTPSDIDVT